MNNAQNIILWVLAFAFILPSWSFCQDKQYSFPYETNSFTGTVTVNLTASFDPATNSLKEGHEESEIALMFKWAAINGLPDGIAKEKLKLVIKSREALNDNKFIRIGLNSSDFLFLKPPASGTKSYAISIELLNHLGQPSGTINKNFHYTVTPKKKKPEVITGGDQQQGGQKTIELTPAQKEQAAWSEANSCRSIPCYKTYLREFPNGKHAQDAKERIADLEQKNAEKQRKNSEIELDVIAEGNVYTFSASNLVSRPSLNIPNYESEVDTFESVYDELARSYSIKARIEGYRRYDFEFSDAGKNINYTTAATTINNDFSAEKSALGGDSLSVSFTGGISPYELVFLPYDSTGSNVLKDQEIVLAIEQANSVWKTADLKTLVQIEARANNYKLQTSKFNVLARDINRNRIIDLETIDLDLEKTAPPTSNIPLYAGIGVGVIALFFIIYLLAQRSKKKKTEERLERAHDHLREHTPVASKPETVKEEKKPTKPQPEKDRNFKGGTIGVERKKTNTPIVITRRKMEEADANQGPIDWEKAMELPMAKHWQQSTIQSIYFVKDAIWEIDEFLVSRNTSKMKEQGANIPEIGGMLMGRYEQGRNGQYRVIVEKFVPISASTETVISLEFSEDSIAKDLVSIQDEFPAYKLVGWFHTHPGHGLFLSKPDLNVQYGFFPEPYQFAMEIDSLTENLDTAFFTWQKEGEVNNIDQRIGDSWFYWVDFQKFTRRNI